MVGPAQIEPTSLFAFMRSRKLSASLSHLPRFSTPTEPPGTTTIVNRSRSTSSTSTSATILISCALVTSLRPITETKVTSTPPRRRTSTGATTSTGSKPSPSITATVSAMTISFSQMANYSVVRHLFLCKNTFTLVSSKQAIKQKHRAESLT